ncbi:MAG: hypothetical protein Q4D51_02950 [Eubacteriales bacterium]|nr:hypothetical protein [Eubacteriales bacterium]
MTVGEARQTYSSVLKSYNTQKFNLGKQKTELDEKIKKTENGAVVYANEAATLELTYNAVSEKQDEYQKYVDQLMEQWSTKFNQVAMEEQVESEKEGFDDLRKILEVVRRMTKGDNVPQGDEKRVMEYDKDMYQMAKSAQMVAQMRKRDHEDHDSLWEDEEEREQQDPMEVADGQEAFMDGPEVVSVEDTMAAAVPDVEAAE